MFAVFTQLFFIQLFVRFLFRIIFKKQLAIQADDYVTESIGI